MTKNPKSLSNASQGDQGGVAGADKAGPTAPTANDQTGEMEQPRHRIRVTAPAGPRRRAGISFGPVAITITLDQFGETAEEQEQALSRLMADPALSVAPVVDDSSD